MNILYITQRIPYPANKGEKLRTFHQIEHLVNQGARIDVYCLRDSPEDDQYAVQLAQYCNEVVVGEAGFKYLFLVRALLQGQALSVGTFYRPSFARALRQKVATTAYDAVIFSASSLYPYLEQLRPVIGKDCKVLFDFMDVDSDKWRQYSENAMWPMSFIYQRESSKVFALEASCLQDSEAVLLIADKEKQLCDTKHANAGNVVIVGNGIDETLFYPCPEPSTQINNYLFVGVMDYKPNIDAMTWFVSNVWPSIVSDNPNASLTIVGMNPTSEIVELAQEDSITVTGRVDDVTPYFHQADLFVAPFQIARGVQNKILQAMACGLPVLASSLGFEGINIQDKQTGFICNSVSDYLQAIRLLEDKVVYQSMTQASSSMITEHYSWSSQLAPLLSILQMSEDTVSGNQSQCA